VDYTGAAAARTGFLLIDFADFTDGFTVKILAGAAPSVVGVRLLAIYSETVSGNITAVVRCCPVQTIRISALRWLDRQTSQPVWLDI
jgi:hypothetical protein